MNMMKGEISKLKENGTLSFNTTDASISQHVGVSLSQTTMLTTERPQVSTLSPSQTTTLTKETPQDSTTSPPVNCPMVRVSSSAASDVSTNQHVGVSPSTTTTLTTETPQDSTTCVPVNCPMVRVNSSAASDASTNQHVGVSPSQTTTLTTETSQDSTTYPPINCSDGESSSQPTQTQQSHGSSGGAVYVRWGKTVCPANATLVYKGLAGGSWYEESGGGSNYLCLTLTPEYADYDADVNSYRAYVYSAEYKIGSFAPISFSYQHHEVPCAVCRADNRVSHVMIPAMMTCPDSWTREYWGYLMATRHIYRSSEFVCVDQNPEILAGSSAAGENGALFHPVESRCDRGNLPCGPYIDGAELTCVVCTK
ncbi:uncharacterized protein [Amphiura filiformis]|uniref:uncharacterized protein n=1 Tax=Amphiura filiformis TaxID=82378 RepID=UPI003B20C13E